MSDQPANTKTYLNHTITLSLDSWKFTVSGPEFDDERYTITFESFYAAQQEVKKRVEDSQKEELKNVKLDITLLHENGEQIHVTSINRSTAEITKGVRYLYPNIPWVQESLKRRSEALAEANRITDTVSPLRIENGRSYGRIGAAEYPAKVKSLLDTVKSKTDMAIEKTKISVVDAENKNKEIA
jgi:hypothetical protein